MQTDSLSSLRSLDDADFESVIDAASERIQERLAGVPQAEWMTHTQATQPRPATIPCTRCEGTGSVDGADPASGRTTGEWSTTCPVCFGKKLVSLAHIQHGEGDREAAAADSRESGSTPDQCNTCHRIVPPSAVRSAADVALGAIPGVALSGVAPSVAQPVEPWVADSSSASGAASDVFSRADFNRRQFRERHGIDHPSDVECAVELSAGKRDLMRGQY